MSILSALGGLVDAIVVDTDTLWLIGGGVVLAIGLIALGININIRLSRESARDESRALRKQVKRLEESQSGALIPDSELRREALGEALRRRPELAEASDSESARELQTLVEEVTKELTIRQEIAALKAHEEEQRRRAEAEAEAARRTEEAKRMAAERQRAAEEAHREREHLRSRQLAAMSPSRRWMATHKPLMAGLIGAMALCLAAVGFLVVTTVVSAQRQQAQEAEAAAQARAAAESASQASQAAQAEADRITQLAQGCDTTTPEQDIPDEVWIAWLACEDEAVAAKSVNRAPRDLIDAQTLDALAKSTPHADVARFITGLQNTPLSAHQSLVERWDPETVGRSYALVYDQPCSMGVKPEDYVADFTWKTESGKTVSFLPDGCAVRGFAIPNNQYLSLGKNWIQKLDVIDIGPYRYLLQGATLRLDPDSTWSDVGSPPTRLTRQ